MSSFFVITGPGRCGTKWLAHALITCPGVVAHHDMLAANRLYGDIAQLRSFAGDRIGIVSGHARQSIPIIHKELTPTWAFLWRDPLPLVRSYVDISLNDTPSLREWEPERLVHWTAHHLFSDLELSLRLFDDLGIPLRFFYMPLYTTPKGFGELCEHLGIQYDGHALPPPMNALPRRAPDHTEWSAETTSLIRQMMDVLPLLSRLHRDFEQFGDHS